MKLILDLTPEEIAILQQAIERGELKGYGVEITNVTAIPEDDASYEKYKQASKRQQPVIEKDAKLPAGHGRRTKTLIADKDDARTIVDAINAGELKGVGAVSAGIIPPTDAKSTPATSEPNDAVDSVEHEQRKKKDDLSLPA